MKVKVVRTFIDKTNGEIMNMGEEFITNKNRFKEINSTKYGTLVEEVNETDSNDDTGNEEV